MEWDKIIQHDVTQRFPLDDNSIDVVITSPPYWGLRDYGVKSIFGGDPNCKHDFSEYDAKLLHENRQNLDGGTIGNDKFRKKLHGFGNAKAGFCSKCDAWYGQLGLEPHPQMFIDHLVMICREIKRVLKKSGSFYLNLGDTYGSHTSKRSGQFGKEIKEGFDDIFTQKRTKIGFSDDFIMEKNLLMIPSRVVIALQDDGWILRNDIIWHKPNPMPSSCKDRLNTTFEHVFHFVRSRKYYYDLDAIREPHTSNFHKAGTGTQSGIPGQAIDRIMYDIKGKNPGDILEYDSKYKDATHGQTPQGFTRVQSIAKERTQSREDAKKLYPNDPKKQQEYINYIHDHGGHPMGPNPGDVIKSKFGEGKGYNNPKLNMRHGLDNSTLGTIHSEGKNPGDVIKWDDDAQYPRSIMKFGKGQTTESLHRDGNGVYHPKGKNPGDIVRDRDRDVDRIKGKGGNESGIRSLSGSTYPYTKGKNPGDIIQFDEEYWWSFILGNAHSNRFYKKAFEIMKEWMVKNNCFDYNIFYEWYKKEFEGKWKSGNLVRGKANYLSDEKRLPFPKSETRFLGDVPGDFWEICTSPFTGYNPELEHFAVFSEDLVLKPLKASCPRWVCKKCGKPRERISKKIYESAHQRGKNYTHREGTNSLTSSKACKEGGWNELPALRIKETETLGWADCGCNAGFRPGVVLDPFCGRGTVGKVAKSLGLHYILFDAKPEYCELSRLYIAGQKYKLIKYQQKLEGIET